MKLSPKDLVAIAAVTILSFPVFYLFVMFSTGNMRVEIGKKPVEEKRGEDFRVMQLTDRRDSLLAQYSAAYRAMVKQRSENEEKERQLREREERLVMLQQELEEQRKALEVERERLEKAVEGSDEASEKKIRQLARVYGAMRPAEAAQILETLNDNLVVNIIRGIDDERQKGKIMSALSRDKAARVSAIMGAPVSKKK
jgi:flagellar motility protein MotE (MotC chaperone)